MCLPRWSLSPPLCLPPSPSTPQMGKEEGEGETSVGAGWGKVKNLSGIQPLGRKKREDLGWKCSQKMPKAFLSNMHLRTCWERGREGGREERREGIGRDGSAAFHTLPDRGSNPLTQVCALNGNRTGNPSCPKPVLETVPQSSPRLA